MKASQYLPRSWRVVLALMLIGMTQGGSSFAGRNADGAMIVHTDDAVAYTPGPDYCASSYLPLSCEGAITRTDKDQDHPALIWFLASFPDSAYPGVTTVEFGIDHNLPPHEGYFADYGTCAALELADTDWPETGRGNIVSFGDSQRTGSLWPFYWFAAYGFAGAYIGTTVNPNSSLATFVDDGVPPQSDLITRFGQVRWYAMGSNDCPGSEEPPLDPIDGYVFVIGPQSRLSQLQAWTTFASQECHYPSSYRTLEQIRHEYATAGSDTAAIKAVISDTMAGRNRINSYVLLVGGWSRDASDTDRRELPTCIVRVGELSGADGLASTDQPYGDIDEDGIWDIAVWRVIPGTDAENATLITKALEYLDPPYPHAWAETVDILSDNHAYDLVCDPGRATDLSGDLISSVGSGFTPQLVLGDDLDWGEEHAILPTELAEGRGVIVAGPSTKSYATYWLCFSPRDYMFNDAASSGRPPLMIGCSCYLGAFDLYQNDNDEVPALCRDWFHVDNWTKGPISWIGPTRGTYQYANYWLAARLLELMTIDGHTFGQALLAATRGLEYLLPAVRPMVKSYVGLGIPWLRLVESPPMNMYVGQEASESVARRVFPNPITIGQAFTIQASGLPREIPRVTLYDVNGRQMSVALVAEVVDGGVRLEWRRGRGATHIASGMYTVRLQYAHGQRMERILILK
jgi:hypothetical protein